MDLEIPGYTLLRTLGKGGMATVYLAKQAILERHVALKVMSKNLAEDSAFGQRFMREAKIVSQLVHPNIVTVHEVGQHDGHYYLSMEYIDGHDLRTVRKKLDLLEKIRVIEDIARALYYAGEKGYVHRDIKPENIMFRSGDGSAVLTDFGIAKAVESDLTMTQVGTAIGTPHYMSPEQAKGKAVDHRSDLYGLGVVFFLLLTGRVPYDADTAVAIGIKHITEPVPVLPAGLELLQPVIDGLLAKKPENRYQNGLALLNDLRTIDLNDLVQSTQRVDDQPTVSDSVPTAIIDAGADNEENDDTSRFTIEYELDNTIERPSSSIWPMFFASSFIVFALFLMVYVSRPVMLEPLFIQIDLVVGRYVREGGSKFETVVEEIKLQLPEAAIEDLLKEEPAVTEEVGVQGLVSDDSVESFANVVPESADDAVGLTADQENRLPSEQGAELEADVRIETIAVEADSSGSSAITLTEGALNELNVASESEVAIVELPSVSDLLAQVQEARTVYQNDRGQILNYIRSLSEVLHYYPEDVDAVSALSSLKRQERGAILALAESGAAGVVDSKIMEYSEYFPESHAGEMTEIKQASAEKLHIYRLLERSKSYRASKAYYAPPEANVIEVNEAVLRLSSENPSALKNLRDASLELVSMGGALFTEGDLVGAETLLNNALRANIDSIDAKILLADVHAEIRLRKQLKIVFSSAEKYIDVGQLYAPLDANAFDQYTRALSLDPRNERATKGHEALVDLLSIKVWALVSKAHFDEAKILLARPLALMPENERIKSMLAAVNEVAAR